MTPTATPTIVVATETPPPPDPKAPGMGYWLISMLISWGCAAGIYQVGRKFSTRWGLRWALLAIVGGMSAYFILSLGFPGSFAWLEASGIPGILGITIAGVLVGWLMGALWFMAVRRVVRRT